MPMFNEVDQAVQAVSQDLTDGFRGIFDGPELVLPVGMFAQEAVGTTSASVSVVAWKWPVVHVGPLQGTPATHRSLTLRGVTVIELAEAVIARGDDRIEEGVGDLFFSRYIDWLALYAELGAITIARPQVDDRSALKDNVPHDVDNPDH